MAFTEDTVANNYNSTSNVTIKTGDANGTMLVKNIVVHNLDTVSHTIIIEFVKTAVAYRMFNVTLAPGDSLVQDVLIALVSSSYTLRTRMGEAVTTTQPQFVATLAQHS
jgi:hypothetical protein